MPRFTRKSRPSHLVKRAFRHHYIRNGDPTYQNNGEIQSGTGIIKSPTGYRYQYTYNTDGKNNYVFKGGSGRPCFILMAQPESKTGILQSLESDLMTGQCSLNTGATTQNAGKAAMALAKEKGLTTVELTDNTMKSTATGKKFSLADMYFLTTGKTWYESFLPVRPINPDRIERYRHIVRKNKWSDVLTCLRSHVDNVVIPVSTDDIDVMAEGSAMEVFSKIKKARTDFFATYNDILPLCSGIPSLYGKTWIIVI